MIIPIKENVLVELKKSKIINDTDSIGAHQEGDVVVIGDEVTYVSNGDHIIFRQYAENKVFERDGRLLALIEEKDILAREQEVDF